MVSTVDTKTLKILMLEGVFRVKKERENHRHRSSISISIRLRLL